MMFTQHWLAWVVGTGMMFIPKLFRILASKHWRISHHTIDIYNTLLAPSLVNYINKQKNDNRITKYGK